MSVGLQNYPHIQPADATYLNGNIRDADSGIIPTPVNVLTNGDIHQFFAKLLRDAGITANGNPDNETNGYQYTDALKKMISPAFSSTGIIFVNSGSNVWGNLGGAYYNVGYRAQINTVMLCGVAANTAGGSPLTTSIMNLPAGIRPAKKVEVIAYSDMSGGIPVNVTIDTTGDVTCSQSISGGFNVFLDGVTYRLS